MAKKVRRRVGNIVLILIAALICFVAYNISKGQTPSVFGYRVFRVVSQSMFPTIPDQTCIVIHETSTEELQVGDIITFISTDPTIYGYYNTHRIHEVTTDSVTGEKVFVTKGDANPTPDNYTVSMDRVVGKYVNELPFGQPLAKMMNALSDSKVYFLVIMLPLLICIISYIWQIIRYFTDKDEDDDDEDDEDEDEDVLEIEEIEEDKEQKERRKK